MGTDRRRKASNTALQKHRIVRWWTLATKMRGQARDYCRVFFHHKYEELVDRALKQGTLGSTN